MSEKHRDSLTKQMDESPWEVLVRFYARGGMILVDRELEFIDVGVAIADDETELVSEWLEGGGLEHVTDEHSKMWNETPEKIFRMVIVQPYVLIQEILTS